VLNAQTGAIIRSIPTSAGSTTTPSGLAKISAWVDNPNANNTTLRVYGGDLLGNLWRFDVNGDVGAAGYDAQKLISFVDDSGAGQPITTKPELGLVASQAVVFVGTGQYLGITDLTSNQQQSFYAVKDTLGSTTLGNPRTTSTGFIKQVETITTCPSTASATICSAGQSVRTSTNNTVNFSSNSGWYIDFNDTGERSNTDPQLGLGTLVFNTNTPNSSSCTIGGYSNRYFLDYRTGGPVSTAGTVVSTTLGNSLATRPVLVRLPNNVIIELTRLSDPGSGGSGTTTTGGSGGTTTVGGSGTAVTPLAGTGTRTDDVPIGGGAGTIRRISWRELTN
jgi:type IV pilus assembly protein PilY1